MAREDLHFRLRIPDDLKTRIERSASMNERSMTAEIISRLQWTFGPADEEMLELALKQRAAEERSDALLAELDSRRVELANLQNKLTKMEFELRLSREKLAFEEGVSASLRNGFNIFVKHLASADGDKAKLLDAILDEIKSGEPWHPTDEPDK